MKIAHLSDLHLLDLAGVSASRLYLNKRLTGMVNLRMKREHKHRPAVLEALIDDLRAGAVDHVIVSGDLTNLALDEEFALARRVLDRLALPAEALTVVPGNHDLYTRGAARSERFAKHFGPNIASDLPTPEGLRYPFVRLRGPAAIVGLSTAVPRLPLVASGHLGAAQFEALKALLEHPEVKARTPVVVAHHPVVNPTRTMARLLRGWHDADPVRELLTRGRPVTLSLHGHLHHRGQAALHGDAGETLHVLGATSASLLDPRPGRMGAYNLYELSDDGQLAGTRARVWSPAEGAVVDAPSLGPSAVWHG